MRAGRAVLVAVDAGTTGVRAAAVDEAGTIVHLAYRELTQHFPRPGWVEHDPLEIWSAVRHTLGEVARLLTTSGQSVAALGITNQRETVVAFDRRTGRPCHRAIVWQDRRTAGQCDELREAGALALVRQRTGLVLDPYFSATKMSWLVHHGDLDHDTQGLAMGTVDSWLLWQLTGATSDRRFLTDTTNASRTSLLDIAEGDWSEELCALFGVPQTVLAEVRPSVGSFGTVGADVDLPAVLRGVPITGVAGDQHAALFGQACFDRGSAKATYGTGTFVLVNAGSVPPPPVDGLLTTIAWNLGAHGAGGDAVSYALEGSAFSSGAAIQWLRDGLGVVTDAQQVGPLAESADDSGGVSFVPAFTGLGSPVWDPRARGIITGISTGTGRAQLARAVVDAITCDVRAIAEAMAEAGHPISTLRVDGGAAAMELLLALQAEQLGVTVARPRVLESTVLGAATMAGLAVGVWDSLDDLASLWSSEVEHHPNGTSAGADAAFAGWLRARDRSRGWAH